MKLIPNSGGQRAIDELRPCLRKGAELDIATSAFSLFAFAEPLESLQRAGACRFVLPQPAGSDLALLGPWGTFAVATRARNDLDIAPGVIFCLRAAGETAKKSFEPGYPLPRHYLIHVGDDGTTLLASRRPSRFSIACAASVLAVMRPTPAGSRGRAVRPRHPRRRRHERRSATLGGSNRVHCRKEAGARGGQPPRPAARMPRAASLPAWTIYELLLKLGLDLCVPIEARTLGGKTVHNIGAGALIVCLAEKIAREEIEPFAHGIIAWRKELAPPGDTTVVFRDSAFADDVTKTNLTAILQQ
ncbi:MAG TPA: hypothetical protein VF306_05345, partial [Pirellulales bacterium]